MENNWLKSNKSIDVFACNTTECTAVIDLQAENNKLKVENTQLKERLENKEKAYKHLCNANNRKKEQIKNLNYMLFEEKEMSTQEWKLKYKLANKERKFIQYKDIANKRLNEYKQTFEDIIKYCNVYSKTEDYVIDQTFNEFLENIFNKVNEVLNK